MKAAVMYEPNQLLQVKDLRQDPPKAGEVRVAIGAAGICASDHHVTTGQMTMPLPAVLGHEGAGTVVEVGTGVTRVKPGEPCILSFMSLCGHCRQCRTGNQHLCETHALTRNKQLDGTVRLHDDGETEIQQMGKIGVFAESTVVPQESCFPLKDEVPAPVAALIGCCVTTGTGAVINSPAARPGMTVAVFGCGGVGLNVVQGARLMSASRIIAVDVQDHKLEFSYKFGATDVVNSREVDPVEAIKELTDGGADMTFDSFGSRATAAAAFGSVRKGGTAVMIGLPAAGESPPIDLSEMVLRQKALVGSFYGSANPHETFSKLVGFYRKGVIDIDSLITRTYSLDQVNEGMEALGRGEDGRGVIVFG